MQSKIAFSSCAWHRHHHKQIEQTFHFPKERSHRQIKYASSVCMPSAMT